MIIDIHSHLAYSKIYPKQFLADMFENENFNFDRKLLDTIIPSLLKDSEGNLMIKHMDDCGIGKSVVLIIDCGISFGESELNIKEIHNLHKIVKEKHKERLIIFGGFDPRRGKENIAYLINLIENNIIEGMKLYPPLGYSINGDELRPVYEICNQYKLPVLIHTGASQNKLHNNFANPLLIEDIAGKYGNINFILAHAGLQLDYNLASLIKNFNNLYADIAGFQILLKSEDALPAILENILKNDLTNKILFGSDWPLFNLFNPLKKSIKQLSDFMALAGFTKKQKQLVFYKNAANLLKS